MGLITFPNSGGLLQSIGLYNDLGTIQSPTYTVDSMGGSNPVYTNVAGLTNFAGTLQPASGKLITEYARRNIVVSHNWFTTVSLENVIVGQVLIVSGTLYIIHNHQNEGGRFRVWSLDLERKDN